MELVKKCRRVSPELPKFNNQESVYMQTEQPDNLSYIDYFSDYTTPVKSMFLSRKVGLLENLRNEFPRIWDLYKQLKSLDWEETEINIDSCRSEFKTLPTEISNLMIRTLAWQYEADSSATHICDLMAPFVGCTELKCYTIELAKNECLTPDHQVLTPTGWKDIELITQEDKVAQWDHDTKEISFTNPTLIFSKDFDGDMIRLYNESRSVDQVVTPDHRLAVVSGTEQSLGMKDILAKDVQFSEEVCLPVSGKLARRGIGMLPNELIYTAAQTCGSVSTDIHRGPDSVCYNFFLSDEKKIEQLKELCTKAGWGITQVGGKGKNGVCQFYIPVPDDEPLKDLIGFDWVDLEKITLEWGNDFLKAIRQWSNSKEVTTPLAPYTRETAQKVATIAHITGKHAVVRKNPMYGFYEVSLTPFNFENGDKITKESYYYKGKVHCIGVPSTYFLVKRGNSISVTGNCLHSLAYKVIVESSFDNPEEFLKELVNIKESFQRLDTVKNVFDEIYKLGHEYALGIQKDQHLVRRALFKFWATLYALERIQFMSSFAITFGLAEQGMFVPIAKLVQKICTDEFQIHVQGDKAVLSNEMSIEENFPAYLDAIDDICAVVKEITQSELDWLEFLFDGKEEIGGIRKQSVRNFVLYSATEVYSFYGIENPFTEVKEMPLPYMNKWIVIDSNQSSPQEESVGNYLLGGFVDDSQEVNKDKYGLTF